MEEQPTRRNGATSVEIRLPVAATNTENSPFHRLMPPDNEQLARLAAPPPR